jgi:hypothetical protein
MRPHWSEYDEGGIDDVSMTSRPGDKPSSETDAQNKHMHQTLLPASKLNAKVKEELLNPLEEEEETLSLFDRVTKSNQKDE